MGGHILIQNQNLTVIVHKEMLVWWSASVVRAVTVFGGGVEILVRRPPIARGGADHTPLEIWPIAQTFGEVSVLHLGPVCVITLPTGEEVEVVFADAHHLDGSVTVDDGALDAPAPDADIDDESAGGGASVGGCAAAPSTPAPWWLLSALIACASRRRSR